jgi:hypothetical protein
MEVKVVKDREITLTEETGKEQFKFGTRGPVIKLIQVVER